MSTGSWNTYVAVDDADRATEAARAGGASVTSAPQDAGPAGRWAEIDDPTGGRLRLWQAGYRAGAQAVNSPGAWNFSDLHTADPTRARAFYGSLFGWEADEVGGGAAMWRRPGYGDHLAATVDPGIAERQAAVGAPPGFADVVAWLKPLADGESPHWHVTFAVDDRDAAVGVAERLGGSIVSGPHDDAWTQVGRGPRSAGRGVHAQPVRAATLIDHLSPARGRPPSGRRRGEVQLPGDAVTIGDPTEALAEAVVAERHQRRAAVDERGGEPLDLVE